MPRWKNATMEHAPPGIAWCLEHEIELTRKQMYRHGCIDPAKQNSPGGICKYIIFYGRSRRMVNNCDKCGKGINKRDTYMIVNGSIVLCMECWAAAEAERKSKESTEQN